MTEQTVIRPEPGKHDGVQTASGDDQAPANDLLEGAEPISRFLGLTRRRVFYLAEHRELPLFKLGHKWCARKSTLLAHFAELEKAA